MNGTKVQSSTPDTALTVLVFFSGNETGGPGKGLLQLIDSLQKERVRFIVCGFRHPDQASFELMEVARSRGVDFRTILQRSALDPAMIRQALNLARQSNADIVQSHGYKTHILAWIAARKLTIPWVALSHGWTAENLKIKLYNFIERVMLRYADLAIGVSPPLFEEARKIRRGRRTVQILNAIDKNTIDMCDTREQIRERHGIPEEAIVLGIFGRLSREKGQDQMLEAMSLIEAGRSVYAVFVGDGVQRQLLERQSEKLGLDERVRFVGYRTNVVDYFGATDICVLPSRSEGLPNVVLEAQCAGVPVVAFNVGGVSEAIVDGETGWLVNDGNVRELAGVISRVADSAELRQKVARLAVEHVFPKFSVERRAAEFLSEYRSLTGATCYLEGQEIADIQTE